jgi:hypothetical protein
VGQAHRLDPAAEAIAEALDPLLVARLATQAFTQGVQLLGRGGVLQRPMKRLPVRP